MGTCDQITEHFAMEERLRRGVAQNSACGRRSLFHKASLCRRRRPRQHCRQALAMHETAMPPCGGWVRWPGRPRFRPMPWNGFTPIASLEQRVPRWDDRVRIPSHQKHLRPSQTRTLFDRKTSSQPGTFCLHTKTMPTSRIQPLAESVASIADSP